MAAKPESLFRARAQKQLNKLPHWTDFSIQQLAKVGDPDKLCVCRGTFIAIEFKSSKGKPTKLQRKVLTDIDKAGGYVFVAYPWNWDAIFAELENFATKWWPLSSNETRADLWKIEPSEKEDL